MKLFLNITGLLFYCLSIYCMFFSDPTESGSVFKIVGGDAYNYQFAFLGAVSFAVMGTGFIVMATSYPSRDYSYDEINQDIKKHEEKN